MCVVKNPVYQNKPYIVNETAGTSSDLYLWFEPNQPYCDGSHKGTGKKPSCGEDRKDRRVAYCGCCSSREMPFCDGTHSIL